MGGAMPANLNFLRGVAMLVGTAIVLEMLYWLQPVLIPIALAILLTFLLRNELEKTKAGQMCGRFRSVRDIERLAEELGCEPVFRRPSPFYAPLGTTTAALLSGELSRLWWHARWP
jgi:hypothetical protein